MLAGIKGAYLWSSSIELTHYLWSCFSWDEWVPEDRILKFVETSLLKQKELKKDFEAS
jgi:hypothetical protein